MVEVKKYLDMLGYEVKDKVSDYKGVVISMSFDLYGCIQADVRPKELDKDGKMQNGFWLDVNRLVIISDKPLMEPPELEWGSDNQEAKRRSRALRGPANLPRKE